MLSGPSRDSLRGGCGKTLRVFSASVTHVLLELAISAFKQVESAECMVLGAGLSTPPELRPRSAGVPTWRRRVSLLVPGRGDGPANPDPSTTTGSPLGSTFSFAHPFRNGIQTATFTDGYVFAGRW